MAETVNDNQDAQTVQADDAPTQEPPAKQQIMILQQYVPSVLDWFNAQEPGLDETERDYLVNTLSDREGGYKLTNELPERYRPEEVAFSVEGEGKKYSRQRAWELAGLWLKDNGRYFEALVVLNALYEQMIRYEIIKNTRTHKGMPLVWMSECFRALKYSVHSKRYLMYTLCEDAVTYGKEKRAADGGVYFRAVWQYGMSEPMVNEYTGLAYDKAQELGESGWFPERLLAELDDRWMTESPSEEEFGRYWCNRLYVEHLMGGLGTTAGQALERLAHYLLSMIPGCRAYRRQRTPATDHDVVGSFEGPSLDFRSELGRYFVCECKDWKAAADFTTMAKLARVLDSVKSRFGIIFSNEGISGLEKTEDAAREQLKVFADRGVAIVVVEATDLARVVAGENFLAMIRSKYEHVRLDLAQPKAIQKKTKKPKKKPKG
jgi:hypothetical protein